MPRLSRSEAAYILGVSTDTLRRWEKEGKITSTRTEGGHRRYDLTDILKDKEDEGLTILYARVSTPTQIKDLDRQIAVLETYAEIKGWKNCKTIRNIGSGVTTEYWIKQIMVNFSRRTSNTLSINYQR